MRSLNTSIIEVIMKKYSITILTFIAVGLTAATFAQNNERPHSINAATISSYGNNLETALHSQCDGLIESALMQTAKIKIKYPAADFSKIEGEMEDLSVQGSSQTIRYEAYLAACVCKDPESFRECVPMTSNETGPFFASIAHAMQQRLMGYNGVN
jgi:hypothetical protein